jgi:hypothetical protein
LDFSFFNLGVFLDGVFLDDVFLDGVFFSWTWGGLFFNDFTLFQ